MVEDFSMIFSIDLLVPSVTRMKIPVVLDLDIIASPHIVYHDTNYNVVLFKMDHCLQT